MPAPPDDLSDAAGVTPVAVRSPVWRFVALALLVVAASVAMLTGATPDVHDIAAVARDAGPAAPVFIVVATAVLLAVLVPRTVLAAAAGVLFGAALGALYVLAGALLGAAVAFAVGRALGREFVRSRPFAAGIDRLLQRGGLAAVVTLRLLPVAPFGLVSYALGATGVRAGTYLLGTAAGIAPGTVVFAFAGASALQPTSPAFIASCFAAVALAVTGLLGARAVTRSRPAP